MVRYYGYYSNKSRGMRKKAGIDDQVPALVESAVSSTAFRKNWARLIQKIYQIDPLLCPKMPRADNDGFDFCVTQVKCFQKTFKPYCFCLMW